MIIDDRLEMGDATSSTSTNGATRLIGDQINLSDIGRDIGNGERMYWVVNVDTTFTSTGAPTAVFSLVSDDTASISATGGATTHAQTGAIALASLVAGASFAIAVPPESPAY